ncbi:MAG TPA: hypothetical protein VKG43_02690 [Acidimicrobiales bacterium]|nr:hypothetical protein [Acidimicrobiales bacterium]
MTAGQAPPFTYEGYELDPAHHRLRCSYRMGDERFVEAVTFDPGGDWGSPAAEAAARLVFLLAGVSYYKTAAPEVVDLGDEALTESERALLGALYRRGLAEFAHRNGLDLSGLRIEGPGRDDAGRPDGGGAGPPLVPFGGGIDSVVTAEAVRAGDDRAALFVVSPAQGRFAAIEAAAAVTGLPVRRAERHLDDKLTGPSSRRYLHGHVPVTGVISAIAVLAAVLDGRGAVVMSNERSASVANLVVGEAGVNHQWSKGAEFEAAFAEVVAGTVGPSPRYYSFLRPYSELWVARRFAELDRYHRVFRSCNRAFALDPARRADRWCGRCDKCCFIDLVLAPFMAPGDLAAVFDGAEPLDDPTLTGTFETLVGLSGEAKPFECVGDLDECRAALVLAARRPDRAASAGVQGLVARLASAAAVPADADLEAMFAASAPHPMPDDDAAQDLLV